MLHGTKMYLEIGSWEATKHQGQFGIFKNLIFQAPYKGNQMFRANKVTFSTRLQTPPKFFGR